MIKQIKKYLEDAGIVATNVAIDNILLLSFPNADFLDLMVLHFGKSDKTLWRAEYHSEPIELSGLYLPVFYVMVNTLNEKGSTKGSWSFIVSEGKGYFVYTYRFNMESCLFSITPEIIQYAIREFQQSVVNTVSNQVLSIYRMIDMVKRDRGLGSSMSYAMTLTTNINFEEFLPAEERQRLLLLQEKVGLFDDYEVSREDELALEKLYESQINALHEKRITASVILFNSVRRVFHRMRNSQ